MRWLDALLAAFAGHPAVAAWELGHDPASTIRPARIADMAGWAALLGERVRAQDEQCRLTLGQGDVVRGRGVRLAAVAEHVDALGLALRPQRLPLPGDPLDAGRGVFVVELAHGAGRPVARRSSSSWASRPAEVDARRAGGRARCRHASPRRTTSRLAAATSCCSAWLRRVSPACTAAAWSDWGARLREVPPSDRRPVAGAAGNR